MTLIIFCHPDPKGTSHSHKILRAAESILKKEKTAFETIDLYKDQFDAYLSGKEYFRIKEKSVKKEEGVSPIQEKISKASTLIFIYPVWWYNMPALLKGFMDRVFTARFAYRFFKVNKAKLFSAWLISWVPGVRTLLQHHSAKGLLKGKKALIFRTYGGPALGKRIFGNTQKSLENSILHVCGIKDITVHELFNCDKESYTQEHEKRYLDEVENIVKKKTKHRNH